jgi:hypothetical protein
MISRKGPLVNFDLFSGLNLLQVVFGAIYIEENNDHTLQPEIFLTSNSAALVKTSIFTLQVLDRYFDRLIVFTLKIENK